MTSHLLAAAGVLALLTLLPGPDLAVVTRRALVHGPGAALRTGLGVVTGLLVWGTLTALGLAALLTASPQAYLAVRVVGTAYLVFLGVQALRGARPAPTQGQPVRGRPFLSGLATNLLNPKIAVFYAALLPTLALASLGTWGLVLLVGLHAVLTLAWFGLYVGMLTRARAVLSRPRVQRALERVTGVALLGFAARLAVDS